MPASRSAPVEPSNTKRVLDALIAADDFLPLTAIAEASGVPAKACKTALAWLRHAKAVDSVDSGGVLYWYATPDTDRRRFTIDEHRKEDEPRTVKSSRRIRKMPQE